MVKQSAFVFVKPHANTGPMKKLVTDTFATKGITIIEEGDIAGPEIDQNKFIDQHYYAIASKATILPPEKLNVPADKFMATFGEEWDAVKADGRVFNALGLKEHLKWDAKKLDEEWSKTDAKNNTRVKFGGGFYCGKMEVDGVNYYTFNAFFMTMRGKFTGADAVIHYYVVEFDSDDLKWEDFRGKVLGPTNPAEGPEGSLRGTCFKTWQSLGLTEEPNTGDNAVHASASPFEGLAERTNWLGTKFTVEAGDKQDAFAKAMVAEGISEETIKAWSVDPQVKGKSLFDQVEDMDFAECLAKLKELNA